MFFSVAPVRSLRARPYHAAAALFFILVGAFFYGPFLHDLPNGIHTWAQTDRLAVALNFYDYGFDFFTPRTSALVSIGGITGVEFPLQAYVAALGGLVFGRGSIVTLFRLLDVVVTLVGCYYLFRLVFEHTGHFVAGLVPGAFLLASPFFSFYAAGFVPDPFSLSLSFVAYYYWLRFFETRHFPDLRLALLVLGLAALVKTTTFMHFTAVAGITLLWSFLEPGRLTLRQRLEFLGLAGGVVVVVGLFFAHNQSLNATYQSGQFLAEARPIPDDDVLHDVLKYVRRDWINEYATPLQYGTLAVCGGLLLLFIRRNIRRYLPLTLLLVAATLLGVVFVQLMGVQLSAHDYYAICSAIPPAMLLLLLGLLNVGHYTGKVRYATSLGLGVLLLVLVANGYERTHARLSDDYPPFSPYAHIWMRGGAAELARAQVPAASTILVLDELAPNAALVYFDRRGLTWQPQDVAAVSTGDLLNRMANDSLDYLVMAPSVYARLPAAQHETMATEFDEVGQHPAMVFRRRNRTRPW